ncbi:stalk domain-containing protein [Paenibacillus sp. y28]|uniref:stalk domain-containing protein n=1 Tax=Paenibacillus sp. y28 TaxID=3129110 RepID=UPI003019194D
MKKYFIGFISGAMLATVGSVYAADALEKVEAYLKPQSVKLNGQSVTLENPAIVYDGSTYLKVRDIGKITGLHVDWNAETETVELSSGKGFDLDGNPSSIAQTDGIESIEFKLEVLDDYITDSEGTALKYKDTIYLPLTTGAQKYNIDKREIVYTVKDKTVSFTGKSINIPILDKFEPNCDGFFKNGMAFVREDIFSQVKK